MVKGPERPCQATNRGGTSSVSPGVPARRKRQSRIFFQAFATFQNAGKKCELLAMGATGPSLQARQRCTWRRGTCGLYAVSCGMRRSHSQPPAVTLPPALPASGKGASRPLPSGLPARKPLADNPLASVAGQPVASRPSPSGALRAALTRPSAPRPPRTLSRCFPHGTTRGPPAAEVGFRTAGQ